METTSLFSFAFLTLRVRVSKSSITSSTQPCECLVIVALGFTSATTVMQPAIFPAFG